MIELNMKEHGYNMQTEFDELSISSDSEYGFRPFQLMIASIAGCSSIAMRVVLTKMRLDFKDIRVSAEVERNQAKANRIEKIHLHFVIRGENLRQEKIEKAGAIARKNCGMVQSVQDSIEVTESFEIH
ncbi:osmotically inducible protein C [Bacillus sp. J14TS2]|nr:osmotically inducible protein C [Bacillus sp. J14TS2]